MAQAQTPTVLSLDTAGITQEENETNFNYNSLQAGLRMENKPGLTTQLSYTWSHNIDIGQNDLAGTDCSVECKVRQG